MAALFVMFILISVRRLNDHCKAFDYKQFRKMRKEGVGINKIARKLGIGVSVVSRVVSGGSKMKNQIVAAFIVGGAN